MTSSTRLVISGIRTARPRRTSLQARRIVTKAAQAALTKKGVAVVIVNGDMFTETDDDAMDWQVHRPHPVCRPNDTEMAELAALVGHPPVHQMELHVGDLLPAAARENVMKVSGHRVTEAELYRFGSQIDQIAAWYAP